jgi:hypothetical protein
MCGAYDRHVLSLSIAYGINPRLLLGVFTGDAPLERNHPPCTAAPVPRPGFLLQPKIFNEFELRKYPLSGQKR